MKYLKILMILCISCIACQINAQITIGLKGGYVKAWEEYGRTDLPDDAQIHVKGIQLTALVYQRVNKHFSVGIEPGYAHRGAACEPGFIIFNEDTKLLLNYIEMPLMVSANCPVYKNKIEVFGKLGYGGSILASAYREITNLFLPDDPVERNKLDVTNNPNLRQIDHGLYGGLGLAFNLNNDQIFLESNYYYGLRDVDKFNTSKNRSMQVTVGFNHVLVGR